MKTTSWPFNYPNSDEWPPRKRWPVVNSYANYPGMEIINNALKYSEADFNRLYANELILMAYEKVVEDIGMERYKMMDFNRALLHPNNAIAPFLRQAIETEFTQNLEPELRKLWKPILEEMADEESVSDLIDFSIRHLKMTLESALLGGNPIRTRKQGKRALGEQLAKARLLADDELQLDSRNYETLINQQYPNAPFRNAWDEPAPFSRYVLGKYPEPLFAICGIPDFEIEARDLQVFTYAQAVEMAKQYIEPLIGEFSATWLSYQTGLPQAIFDGLIMTAEPADRESAVMALVNATCGIDELVDSAIADDGFNSYLGWEHSNEDDPYKVFNHTEYLVGVVE